MIKLLVVDDSALMRRLLGRVFGDRERFEVAFARDGREALERIAEFEPDVVTLDVVMPEMDGLSCLDRIMVEHPRPVLMISALTEAGADLTLHALDLGAVDFLPKPRGAMSLAIDELAPLLLDKVVAAAQARPRGSRRLIERVRRNLAAAPPPTLPPASRQAPSPTTISADEAGIVLVGASTGGPPALDALLAPLPVDFPWPIVIAQHMPASFTGPLARRLDNLCALRVSEVTRAVRLQPGHAYIGHGDCDLVIGPGPQGPVARTAPAAPEYRWHPSVDRLVASALQCQPAARLIGVLLTGMGNDGAASMTRLRAEGGRTIAEAKSTAVVWGMPGELVRADGAQVIARREVIARTLCDWLE